MAAAQTPRWHAEPVETALSTLESSSVGLTSDEAARRLEQYGPNVLQGTRRVSPWSVLARQLKNVFVVILLLATVVSVALGQTIEGVAIAAIVLLAVVLGFVQEYRAERVIATLRELTAPVSRVLRDGHEVEVPARDLVPGDVVRMQAGDRVPADGRLVESVNLRTDESALTGESVPIDKTVRPVGDSDAAVGDQTNMIFAGTTVTYGRGQAVVVATGMASEFGQIADLLQTVEPTRTPLQVNLDRVGRTLAKAALTVVAIIVGLGLVRGQPFFDMLVFGIALAVAVVPEALPAVVTISLAIGVQRMAKRRALVRRLPAVETLGSTSVICSDKTGTLTKDEMTVRSLFVAGETVDVSGSGYDPSGQFVSHGAADEPSPDVVALLRAAALASDAQVIQDADQRWQVLGDPTEGALVVAAAKAGLAKATLDSTSRRIDEIPFTSEAKRMTTLHATPDGVTGYSKGAPEVILESCTSVAGRGGTHSLEPSQRAEVRDQAKQLADRALRVLAVATKPNATKESAGDEMVFLGLIGMIDPPRPEAATAIEQCGAAGIRVVMITGDHPHTAAAVARELGLLTSGRIVTGAELTALSDDQLRQDVGDIAVFARVSPADKLRIVAALQAGGHVTAMTGDGVNDAPALKRADIGVAMGITGTDVTKEAADMSLTDDNFASIVAAVEEGRGVYDNIKKFLSYLLAANIGEIGLVAGASLLGYPLPLTAVQILAVNLGTDGLPALALAVDPPANDIMRRPPRDPRTGIWTPRTVTLMLVAGTWSAAINLALFQWALAHHTLAESMALVFVTLVLVEFAKAYSFRSDRTSVVDRPFANRWLNLAVLAELGLLVGVVYTPWLQAPLGTHAFRPVDWLIAAGVAATVLPVLDLAKRWIREDEPRGPVHLQPSF